MSHFIYIMQQTICNNTINPGKYVVKILSNENDIWQCLIQRHQQHTKL